MQSLVIQRQCLKELTSLRNASSARATLPSQLVHQNKIFSMRTLSFYRKPVHASPAYRPPFILRSVYLRSILPRTPNSLPVKLGHFHLHPRSMLNTSSSNSDFICKSIGATCCEQPEKSACAQLALLLRRRDKGCLTRTSNDDASGSSGDRRLYDLSNVGPTVQHHCTSDRSLRVGEGRALLLL